MKQTAKRLLSMALAFVMVLSLLPAMSVTALADEEGEDDSTTKDAFGIAMTEWTEAEKIQDQKYKEETEPRLRKYIKEHPFMDIIQVPKVLQFFGYEPTKLSWYDISTKYFLSDNFIRDFHDEVPGASAKDCGNYLDMNLGMANYLAKRYLDNVLYGIDDSRLIYPQ